MTQVRLAEYLLTMVEPDIEEEVERGEPSLYGGCWSPGWCTSRPYSGRPGDSRPHTNSTEPDIRPNDSSSDNIVGAVLVNRISAKSIPADRLPAVIPADKISAHRTKIRISRPRISVAKMPGQ
jgi:hypothetical protein